MVIKSFFALSILTLALPALAGKKEILWEEYDQEAKKFLNSKTLTPELKETHASLIKKKEELDDLEYKENETEQLSAVVETHLKELEGHQYQKSSLVFLDYMSWQNLGTLKTPTEKDDLIITNSGYCAGGAYGFENARFHYFVDGCFFYGWANVGVEPSGVTYHQSNISTYGLKASPGAGMFVSSTKAELGLKIPLVYSQQSLSKPNQAAFPGYSVQKAPSTQVMFSFFFRYPIAHWFFQTEFGKTIGQDTTLWTLGIGYKF